MELALRELGWRAGRDVTEKGVTPGQGEKFNDTIVETANT